MPPHQKYKEKINIYVKILNNVKAILMFPWKLWEMQVRLVSPWGLASDFYFIAPYAFTQQISVVNNRSIGLAQKFIQVSHTSNGKTEMNFLASPILIVCKINWLFKTYAVICSNTFVFLIHCIWRKLKVSKIPSFVSPISLLQNSFCLLLQKESRVSILLDH